jgi:hypothetical protein
MMITWKVLKESNGYNIYDADDMSEWLLGNLSEVEAKQLAKELDSQATTLTLTKEAMTKEQQELVDYLRSHVWAGGKPSDEKLKAATLIEQQARELLEYARLNTEARVRIESLNVQVSIRAREIEMLDKKLEEQSVRLGKLKTDEQTLRTQNERLVKALDWAFKYLPKYSNAVYRAEYEEAKALSRAKVEVE